MNRDHFKKILEAAREAQSRTNVEHEQAFYGAWIDALSAELGENQPAAPAANTNAGTVS